MAFYRRRRFGTRSRYSRGYGSRYRRSYGTARSYYGRRRRTRGYRRSGSSNRTIRLVIQTVAASPAALGMKGQMPVRRMF